MKRHNLIIPVLILLVTAFLRIYGLHEAPPGLQHDEVINGIDGQRAVEQGDFRFFYASNQGREGANIWLIGAAHALFGSPLLSIRLPSIISGLLTVALLYRLGGRLYGRHVGIVAAVMGAVSFWTIFVSRVGLRAALLLPVVLGVIAGLHALFFERTVFPGRRWGLALITGVLLGFASYTYTASVALYAAYGLFLLVMLIFARDKLLRRWPEVVVVTVIGLLITIPIIDVRLSDTGQERVSRITRPLDSFLEGEPQELIDNAFALLGMPAFTGDPEWRYNVPGRPLFLLPIGLLVYVGFGVLLWRLRRRPINAMFIGLMLAGAFPSLLTFAAPSYLRSVAMIPPVFISLALGLYALSQLVFRKRVVTATVVVGLVVAGVTGWVDYRAFFDTWSNHPEVMKIYRDDLEQLASHLNGTSQEEPALITADDQELDPLLFYAYEPDAVDPVFFDSFSTIVLHEQPVSLFVSPRSPISESHSPWLTSERGTTRVGQIQQQNGNVAFEIYELNAEPGAVEAYLQDVAERDVYISLGTDFPTAPLGEWTTELELPVNFDNKLELVGLEIPREEIYSTDDGVNNQLYLRPLVHRVDAPYMIYLHLLRPDGTLVAQRDLMGVMPLNWHTETVIQQDNFVVTGDIEPGRYVLTMGLYNWSTMERYPVRGPDGEVIADQIILETITVVPRD